MPRYGEPGSVPDVTYAHLDREPGHPGLALQYWFYYYFNQFNDLHESDWEGMQITFAADTPEQALATGPDEIVVFQHSGGEHTSWDDSRVQKEGTHPVVYSAAGSHATFYSAALWLGNGQNGSGVGCDNTTDPVTAFRPRAILLPDSPVRTGPFAWTSFTGRWGQREAGFNDGPAGPNTKTVWREPFTWMDNTRTASPQVPGGGLLGPSVAHAFCGAVATVTGYLNLAAKSRIQALGLGVGVLLVIVVLISLTTWRPVALSPLHQARALGQILLTSARMYGHYALKLLLIALKFIAAAGGLGRPRVAHLRRLELGQRGADVRRLERVGVGHDARGDRPHDRGADRLGGGDRIHDEPRSDRRHRCPGGVGGGQAPLLATAAGAAARRLLGRFS